MTAQVSQRNRNYRTGSAAQRPSYARPSSSYSAYRQPPVPANQNWRPPPTAANQNYYPRPAATPNGFRVPYAGAAVRTALRYTPVIALGYEMYMNYSAWRSSSQPAQLLAPGWTVQLNCGQVDRLWGRNNTSCNAIVADSVVFDPARAGRPVQVATPTWHINGGIPYTSGYHRVKYYATKPGVSIGEAEPAVAYGRPMTIPSPFNQPFVAPHIMPELDPFALPINSPVPIPMPLPVTAPRPGKTPGRSPQESTSRGPRARPRGRLSQNPYYQASKAGVTVIGTNTHVRKPPGPKEKQKKWSEGVAGSLPSRLLNAVTEVDDVVDALWDAIPQHLRTGGNCSRSLICKAKDVYKNLNSLDLSLAAYNLAVNAVEDAIAGRAIGKLQSAAINAGINPGAINPGGKL